MTDDADTGPADADPNSTARRAWLAELSEVELSALVAVCVAVGVAVWTSPSPLETRLSMLVVSVAVTAGVFLVAVRYLR